MTHADPIVTALTDADAARCWPVFHELRPHIADEADFVQRWRRQLPEGYQLVYVEESGQVVAAAGYRVMTTMVWGRILYLDDLVARSDVHGRGFGAMLLRYVQEQAVERGCAAVHLDTGYQRNAAHLSYLRNGFRLDCHHLAWTR